MDPGELQFDAVLKKVLEYLGVNSAIIFMVALAFMIQSWIGPLRQAAVVARTVPAGWSRATAAAKRNGPARVAASIAITTLVVLAQLLVVYMTYVIGNFFSVLFDDDAERKARIDQLIVTNRFEVLEVGSPQSALSMDWVSGVYVALAALFIFLSYRGLWAAGLVLTLPVIGFTMIALLGIAGTLVSDDIDAADKYYLQVAGTAAAVGVLFCVACVMSLRGSNAIVRAWQLVPR
ncbi:hypothetical protein O7635_15625 [Asanoa sp. WMMD1127]|uniref:hypothetical protein n=1 Tax=Asanoa sp. WMMD1127 TaxID=3016107 RepID=UPI00241663F5|nr:hypothetical protein [Asanoa sp. WMMD1127]MDG4823285.1 hypothetical protein [Asanoa sp. WMMD1127]